MSAELIVLGVVILMGIGTTTNIITKRLDQAARERQVLMDAIAQIEAHVTWQSGFIEMTEGQRQELRKAVESQVSFRKFH